MANQLYRLVRSTLFGGMFGGAPVGCPVVSLLMLPVPGFSAMDTSTVLLPTFVRGLRKWGGQGKSTIIKAIYFGGREKTYQAWYGVPQDSLATNRTFNIAGTDFYSKNPAYKNETDNYGQDYFQLHLAQRLPENLQLNTTLFATLGRGYYEQYKTNADISTYFEDLASTTTDLVRQRWLKNIFYGGTRIAQLQQKKCGSNRRWIGVAVSRKTFWQCGVECSRTFY
jgi:hypothetical protein